jgi:hypothetical protein
MMAFCPIISENFRILSPAVPNLAFYWMGPAAVQPFSGKMPPLFATFERGRLPFSRSAANWRPF